MRDEIYSIVERLAILEGRISPTNDTPITESRQKKPALFNNLKKISEDVTPMVGGVEFAEDSMEEDVLSKVKSSLADYLRSTEKEINQDKTLIKKKKQDLDLKKKELRDLTLQNKSVSHMNDIDEARDPLVILQGELSDAYKYAMGFRPKPGLEDWTEEQLNDPKWLIDQIKHYGGMPSVYDDLDEDPNQGAVRSASGGTSSPTYAESIGSAPVKTVHVPIHSHPGLGEEGGSTLVEIHGDERDGFCIKCAGKEMKTRFKTLDECNIALEMYMAHRKAKHENSGSADYIEEA
jgi:hypothetical protein